MHPAHNGDNTNKHFKNPFVFEEKYNNAIQYYLFLNSSNFGWVTTMSWEMGLSFYLFNFTS